MCCKFDGGCKIPLVKVVDVELAQVVGPETGATSADLLARILNPTKKLSLTFEAFARPGNNGAGVSPAAHDYTGETWQLTSVADGNPPVPLNDVFFDVSFPPVATPRPLPDSYESESGVKHIIATVHVVGAQNPRGQIYILRVMWEPTDPQMSEEERDYWFARCSAVAEPNTPVAIQGT